MVDVSGLEKTIDTHPIIPSGSIMGENGMYTNRGMYTKISLKRDHQRLEHSKNHLKAKLFKS